MSRKFKTSAADDGRTLAQIVADRLGVESADAVALVARGSVYIGRKRVTDPLTVVAKAARLTIHEDDSKAAAPDVAIAYQDSDILVVDKPVGLPSQATRERSDQSVEAWLTKNYPNGRILHRLDRDASGLLMCTLNEDARKRFQDLLDSHDLQRRYVAVVEGTLRGSGVFEQPIGPDPNDHRKQKAGQGKPAHTEWKSVRCSGGRSQVSIQLQTGRTHQIRVHFSSIGTPLVGDPIYGDGTAPRMALHAAELEWPKHCIRSPVPPEILALVS